MTMEFKLNWSTNQLFSCAPCTTLREIIENALDLLNFSPEILKRIEADQDALSLEKKRIRLEDKRYYESKNAKLFQTTDIDKKEINEKDLTLEVGRPRMRSIIAYLFMMVRGYFSSVTDNESIERMIDSTTLNIVLQSFNTKMPGFTTILENLNAISNSTRAFIFDAQIEKILNDGYDDFEKCQIDSTSVKANTEWPTDARILLRLLSRSFHCLRQLNKFGLPEFKLWHVENWIGKLGKLHFRINMTAGKAKSKGKIKKYYRSFLKTAQKLLDYLIEEKNRIEANKVDLAPSIRARLDLVWDRIESDLVDAAKVLYYAEDRVFNGIVLKSTEKILSISDRSAAYIQKGNRNPVIGYKPQIARSGNGFITSMLLPEGNASDSTQFIPVLNDVVGRTTIIPRDVSVDDGYSSSKGRKAAFAMGIEVVSIGGAKGKRLTPEIDWNSDEYIKARSDRSAVESIMFTLKYVFEFGRLRRRGIEEVRAELLEKVIVYNFYKIVTLNRIRGRSKIKKFG